MNKVITLERPTYQAMYRVQHESAQEDISSVALFKLLRDAPLTTEISWESFDADSVPMYFARGMSMLHTNLGKLQDLLQPYSDRDEQELMFMAESLIQARRLIEEIQNPVQQGTQR